MRGGSYLSVWLTVISNAGPCCQYRASPLMAAYYVAVTAIRCKQHDLEYWAVDASEINWEFAQNEAFWDRCVRRPGSSAGENNETWHLLNMITTTTVV